MTLYHSTFRWFGALACTTAPMGHPSADGFHHLNYSMQNVILADVLLLGTLHAGADSGRFPVKPKSSPSGKMHTENHRCRT